MFFTVSTQEDSRFPVNHALTEKYTLNCDEGWQLIINDKCKIAIFKGYSFDDYNNLFDDPIPKHNGNFCLIYVNLDGDIIITHDAERSFPLWFNETSYGNLDIEQGTFIAANSYLKISSNSFDSINFNTKTTINDNLCEDDAVDIIYNNLVTKFTWLKNNCPVTPQIFFTGGVDSLLCLSMLRHLDIKHNLLMHEYKECDKFSLNFCNIIFKDLDYYWGYSQIHYWNTPSWLISGSMGDENFLRGPLNIHLLLQNRGLKIQDVLQKNDYHYKYFTKPSNINLQIDSKLKFYTKNKAILYEKIIEINLNDHQHWHIGNTLTFTPFKDISILATILSMSDADIEKQMMDASLQKKIIAKTQPQLLKYLSKQKNTSYSTVWELYKDLYSGSA